MAAHFSSDAYRNGRARAFSHKLRTYKLDRYKLQPARCIQYTSWAGQLGQGELGISWSLGARRRAGKAGLHRASWDELDKLELQHRPEILTENFHCVTLSTSCSPDFNHTKKRLATSCKTLDEIESIDKLRKPFFRHRENSEQILRKLEKFFEKIFFKYLT